MANYSSTPPVLATPKLMSNFNFTAPSATVSGGNQYGNYGSLFNWYQNGQLMQQMPTGQTYTVGSSGTLTPYTTPTTATPTTSTTSTTTTPTVQTPVAPVVPVTPVTQTPVIQATPTVQTPIIQAIPTVQAPVAPVAQAPVQATPTVQAPIAPVAPIDPAKLGEVTNRISNYMNNTDMTVASNSDWFRRVLTNPQGWNYDPALVEAALRNFA